MLKNKPIIVLGMHRSGTSCLAGSLQKSGVYFGDVSTQNLHNQKGNRENQDIMSLNEKVLKYSDGSWDIPPREIRWSKEHEQEGKEIIDRFDGEKKSICWGFKDPRTLLTFPFWNNLIHNAQLVGTIRSPLNVALSLNTRDPNYTIDEGLSLWLDYNKRLLDLLYDKPFPLISFDYENHLYLDKLKNIKKTLSLPDSTDDIFFDTKLRSNSSSNTSSNTSSSTHKYSQHVDECYKKLIKFLT
ncbi:MAG: hypothetical protein ACI88H_003668 [Cocleimonas sp.]|jgi:hypothetical protein